MVVIVFSYAQSKDTLKSVKVEATPQPATQSSSIPLAIESVPKHDYELLERKLSYSEFIISSLNTAITIIAVLFGFLLPLLSYVFVIKPQNELKKTLNNSIEQYLEKNRKTALKKAFVSLKPTNPEVLRRLAVGSINQHLSVFPQRDEILELTHAIELEPNGGLQQDIHHILIYLQHEVTEAFYSQQWKNANLSDGEHYANVYFTYFPENAMTHFINALKTKTIKFNFFNKFLKLAIEFRNASLVKQLLDNDEVAKMVVVEFDPQTANPQHAVLINMMKNSGMSTDETTGWAFPKALMELSMLTDKNRGIHKPSDLRS